MISVLGATRIRNNNNIYVRVPGGQYREAEIAVASTSRTADQVHLRK